MRRAAFLSVCAAATACGGDEPRPRLDAVSPSVVSAWQDSDVVLTGRSLFADAKSDVDDGSAALDAGWTVLVGDQPVASAWRDPTRIDAVVPAGFPTGTWDVIAVSPDGGRARLADALEVREDPVGLVLSIEDAPGGAGVAVTDALLTADETLVVHAVARDTAGGFAGDVLATWSVGGGIGEVDVLPSSTAVFDATTPGLGSLAASNPYATSGASVALAVTTGRAAALVVSPAELVIGADDAPIAFGVTAAFDADGNPTSDLGTISWSVLQGPIGAIDAASGILTPATAGTGRIRAESSHGGEGTTGDVVIVPGAATAIAVVPDELALSADDAPLTFAVTGVDADGNATTEVGEITWSIASGAITALDPASGMLDPVSAGTGVVRATSSLGPTADADVEIAPGHAATIAVDPDSTAVSADAAPFAFTVTAQDADGNPTADVGVLSWSVATGAITVLDGAGLFTPTAAGTGTVQAVSSHGPSDASGDITVFPGAAAQLTVAPDTLTTHEADVASAFTATAIDADGNATTDLGTLTWSIASGPIGVLNGATGSFAPAVVGTGVVRAASSHGPFDDTGTVTVLDGAVPIVEDPFGDGSAFSYVTGFGGDVVLGPSDDGTALLRMDADGLSPTMLPVTLPRDVTGNVSRNVSGAPYSSLGAAGCAAGTAACGPDDENGRGRLGTVTVGGQEWLIAGGARTAGDLDYLYVTQSLGATAPFQYLDLSGHLSSAARCLTSLHSFDGHLYLGFSDDGANRPGFLDVTGLPAAGTDGRDAGGGDAVDLEPYDMPGVPNPDPAAIDALTDFNGRVYLASPGGWMRAAVDDPGPYDPPVIILELLIPSHWDPATPSAGAYGAKASRATTKTADLFPSDRAVPAFAKWNGRLFAARNTTAGPQLWKCSPGGDGQCDPGEWSLVAANASGDTQLTQFDDPGNTAISLLAATDDFLYVGFDNAGGVAVFRTAALNPSGQGDFLGEAGCSAANHPATCAPFGGPGLGDPLRTRILDGNSLVAGGSRRIFVTAGDGVAPFSLVRLQP